MTDGCIAVLFIEPTCDDFTTSHWTPVLGTGFPLLDTQHQRLFAMVDQMTPLLEAPTIDIPGVMKFIAFLEDYAREHFDCEERCMAEARCPTRAINCGEHHAFLEGLTRFKNDFAAPGDKRELVVILQASLRAWMHNHILKIDTSLKSLAKNT